MARRIGQRGQILPLVGVCLFVLMTFAAFAIDLGYMRYQQRLQQNAADSAALAAASVYRNPSPAPSGCTYGTGSAEATEAVCAADAAAAANGFPPPDVTVTIPPADGGYTGDPNAVETTVTAQHNTIFSGWLVGGTSPSIAVTTRAVALAFGGDAGGCVSAPGSIKMAGGASITANCGMVMGGSFNNPAGSSTTFNIPFIGEATAGGVCGTCSTTGTAFENITVYTDPCSGLASCAALMAAVPLNTAANAACGKAQAVITSVICNSAATDLTPGNTYVYDTVAPPGTLTCSTCTITSGVTLIINTTTPKSITWGGTPGGTTDAMLAPPLVTLATLSTISTGVVGVGVYITDNGCPGNGNLQWSYNGSGLFYAAGCTNLTLNTIKMAASGFAVGSIKNGNGNLVIEQPGISSTGSCGVGCGREPAHGE